MHTLAKLSAQRRKEDEPAQGNGVSTKRKKTQKSLQMKIVEEIHRSQTAKIKRLSKRR
jgi:hypothetical protein